MYSKCLHFFPFFQMVLSFIYFLCDINTKHKIKKCIILELRHEVCSEDIESCGMKIWDIYWRRYKKHCTQDNHTLVPFKVGTLGPHTVLSVSIIYPVVFSWISLTVWNLSPFKGYFNLRKSQKSLGAKSGV